MPRKMDDLTFMKNHLRAFIARKPGSKNAPTAMTWLRAMWTLGVLSGKLDVSFKDQGEEYRPTDPEPTAPAVDNQLQAMLAAADKLKGGVHADQLSEGRS